MTKIKLKRGFAVMSQEQRSRIASLGGLAVSKGSKGKIHMARIGSIGGTISARPFFITKIKYQKP